MAAKIPDQSVISYEVDDAPKCLYEKAKLRIADEANKALSAERDRLDNDLDILENCIYARLGTLTLKPLDILHAYVINFNPAEDNPPLTNLSASQPMPRHAAHQ
jgi:hypothetical protein